MSYDDNDDKTQPTRSDHRRPRSPAWRCAMLVALLAVFLWLLFYLPLGAKPRSKIIYATRYSKEFKYRPAASPVITERLKDGTVRLRGAIPP